MPDDDRLNDSWAPPDQSRPRREPNTAFCVCVVCRRPGPCPAYEQIDGRFYCATCASQQRR